jgi:hypothetical protein
MFKIIGLGILIIMILIGVDYVIVSSTYQVSTITVSDKFINDDMKYTIKTVSLEKFDASSDIYNKIDIGRTYIVKIHNNKIIGFG